MINTEIKQSLFLTLHRFWIVPRYGLECGLQSGLAYFSVFKFNPPVMMGSVQYADVVPSCYHRNHFCEVGLPGHQVWLHFLEGLFLLKDERITHMLMSRKVNFCLRCLIHVFSMSFGRFAQHHRHLLWSENTTTLSIGTSAAFDNWKLAMLTNMSHIKVMGIFHLLLSYIPPSYNVHQRKKLRDVRTVSNRRS